MPACMHTHAGRHAHLSSPGWRALTQRKRGPEQWLLPPPSQRGKSLQQPGQTAAQREEYGGRGGGEGLLYRPSSAECNTVCVIHLYSVY